MRPVATETHLSHGSAWMPRVVPTASLNETLFCTGPKSGRPAATIFSRCQFSLNQPRLSPWTGRSHRTRPGMPVSWDARALSNSVTTFRLASLAQRPGASLAQRPGASLARRPWPSLALRRVEGLGRVLGGRPPVLVRAVPVDGGGEPRAEVRVARRPAELCTQLRGVDRVAQVVAGAVGDMVVCPRRLPHQLEDQLDHVLVVLLAVGTDEVGVPDAAAVEDREHGGGVVVGVDPVAHVAPCAVELGSDA